MTNKQIIREVIACVVVIIIGFVVLLLGTDNFRAFTAEQARTIALKEEQPMIPNVVLEDSKNRIYPLDSFQEDRLLFVTFMYTNCGTVCPQLERNMQKVYEQLPSEYIDYNIRFLSISFDTETDDPDTLTKYQSYFNSDGETWRMARVPNENELSHLLDTLGVIVIPDEYGNFQHNTAFYLIDSSKELIDVLDYTDIDGAVKRITTLIEEEQS